MIDIQSQLNPSQYEAVRTIKGPLLVIAGAGSGKTRVIEYRVLHLIQSNVNPGSILLLTFTRRAAREMISRAAGHDPKCQQIEGGTFHSFAYKTLKRYAKLIGFDDSFSILDEGDAEEAIHKCCVRLGFNDREKRFPKKETLKNIISMGINKHLPIAKIIEAEYPHFEEYAGDVEALRAKYVEYKLSKNYFDYDDLLVYLKLLLSSHKEVRERISQKYQYIMVDEYQDTNTLQGDITQLLAESHKNIMVVGDDAQSIYGFRGANHTNIMKFPDKFADCKIIKLEDNYRSTQSILDVANGVLDNMENAYHKCLKSANNLAGVKPQLIVFKNIYEEAEWVAGRIKELRDAGMDFSRQGVLFRSAYISIPLQAELSKRNIPYQVFGGFKFYETSHVKDFMAHLKIVHNPKDELAWNRILMLIEGIGAVTSERIIEKIIPCNSIDEIIANVLDPQAANNAQAPRCSDAGRPDQSVGTDPARQDAPKAKLRDTKYAKPMQKLSAALRQALVEKLTVMEQVEIFLDYYKPLMKAKFDDWPVRINDLETLRQISARYETLAELLADFAIEAPTQGVAGIVPHTPDDEEPVTLSTIHSAKGLEWDAVFLIGLMDGILPSKFAFKDPDNIEEEHRLFYVGVTRAKKYLALSYYHEGMEGGISQFNGISRFVEASNVIAKLEEAPQYGGGYDDDYGDSRGSKHSGLKPVYDKESLMKKIMDSFT